MFFTRNDTSLLKRASRRLASPRASVFSEFAFIAPILVLTISAMIELASFWDSRVMATHTVWAIGRMASVRAYEDQREGYVGVLHGLKFGESYLNSLSNTVTVAAFSGPFLTGAGTGAKSLPTYGDVTALYMMSTCGIGAFGSKTPQSASAADLKNIFTQQGSMIAVEIKRYIQNLIDDKLKPYLEPSGEGGIVDTIKEKINGAINTVLDKVVQPILDWIGRLLDKIFTKIFAIEKSALDDRIWQRMAKRMDLALGRMDKTHGYNLSYSVPKQANGHIGVWSPGNTVAKNPARGAVFYYPQTATADSEREDGWLKDAEGWPVFAQRQSVVTVSLDWPFSSGWLFPIVGGYKLDGKPVTVHAKSIAYMQPAIDDANLKSSGATAYQRGNAGSKTSVADLNIGGYVNMVYFALQYRMRCETLTQGENVGTMGRSTSYDPQPLWTNLVGYVDANGNDLGNDRWKLLYSETNDIKCYRYTIRMLNDRMCYQDKLKQGCGKNGNACQEGDPTYGQYPPDMSKSIKAHDGFYYRAQWGYNPTYRVYLYGFRNYLCWPTYDRCYVRYAGPELNDDHLHCGTGDDYNEQYKWGDEQVWNSEKNKYETKEHEWGHLGEGSGMFFDKAFRAQNCWDNPHWENYVHVYDLKKGGGTVHIKWMNDNGHRGQLLRTANKYDAAGDWDPRYSSADRWAGDPIVLEGTSFESAGGGAFTNWEAVKKQWQDYFDIYARKNLQTCFRICSDSTAEYDMWMSTNRLMRGSKGSDDKYRHSLLYAQALDFNLAMQANLALFDKRIKGQNGGEEMADDMVDQAGIDLFNSGDDSTTMDPKEWWNRQKAALDKLQVKIDDGAKTLNHKCANYYIAVGTFVANLKDDFENLQWFLNTWYSNRMWSMQPPPPYNGYTEEGFLDMLRENLQENCRDQRKQHLAFRNGFRQHWATFKKAYDEFLEALVNQVQLESELAAIMGYQDAKHGRALTPDDLNGGATDFDDPDAEIPEPAGGDPSSSGNDTYPFGNSWRLEGNQWKGN